MIKILLILVSVFVFTSLSIAVPTKDATRLCWDTPVDDPDGHYVYSRTLAGVFNNDNRYQKVGIETSCISFVDMGITNPDGKIYAITAYDAGGESGYSNEVTKFPLVVPGVPGAVRIE